MALNDNLVQLFMLWALNFFVWFIDGIHGHRVNRGGGGQKRTFITILLGVKMVVIRYIDVYNNKNSERNYTFFKFLENIGQ
jgi:hypothetical protein